MTETTIETKALQSEFAAARTATVNLLRTLEGQHRRDYEAGIVSACVGALDIAWERIFDPL
jgi:hypothetical protein